MMIWCLRQSRILYNKLVDIKESNKNKLELAILINENKALKTQNLELKKIHENLRKEIDLLKTEKSEKSEKKEKENIIPKIAVTEAKTPVPRTPLIPVPRTPLGEITPGAGARPAFSASLVTGSLNDENIYWCTMALSPTPGKPVYECQECDLEAFATLRDLRKHYAKHSTRKRTLSRGGTGMSPGFPLPKKIRL